MNIWHRIITLIAGLVFLPAVALANSSGWYVAVDAGQSHFPNVAGPATQILNPTFSPMDLTIVTSALPINYSDNDTGYRLTAGYQFNPYWGLEASYLDLGQATATRNDIVLNVIPCGLPCTDNYNVNATLKARGWVLAVTGTYPFSDNWSVFARAGVIDARVELDINTTTNNPPNGEGISASPSETSSSSTNFNSTYGLGVNWSFANNWVLRLGWDRYANLGDSSSTGTYSVNLASIGIVYRFR